MKRGFLVFSSITAIVCIFFIVFLATGSWKNFFNDGSQEHQRTRIITPQESGAISETGPYEQTSQNVGYSTKIPMESGEIVIAVLTLENEEGLEEEQIAAYRNSGDAARLVFLTCISFDTQSRSYKRIWDAPVAVLPETISLFSQDIIGDRSVCIIVTGINAQNEHTMTIFRRAYSEVSMSSRPTPPAASPAFSIIAELQIDGSVMIQETGRSWAYQQGITSGRSFNIAAYSHDNSSNNILDQLESIYSYNPVSDQYELVNVSKIPGSQIEQRRLRELLSGAPGVFENFIDGLWYYVSPQGTLDSRQYMYFDPARKEIIFFGDEAQQIFFWQNSYPSRLGLHIRSQNISIRTLLRNIDVELESLESIKLRVTEDVKLKITVGASPWDGSYRRAETSANNKTDSSIKPAINMVYDSSWGRFHFSNTGEYTLSSGGVTAAVRKGHYVFFKIDGQELLELRPEGNEPTESRMVYRVDTAGNSSLSLSRVRIGTAGIQDLHEPVIILTPVE